MADQRRLPPTTDALTTYDEDHLALYLSVLHARAEGVSNTDIARSVFGIDPELDPEAASNLVDAHHRRATWLAGPGAHHLIED